MPVTRSAVARDPVRWTRDTHQTLDVGVHHIAWSGVFVAVGRQLRFQVADAIQLQPPENTADRGRTQAEPLRDPHASPAFAPEPFDLHDPLLRGAAR